MHTKPTEKFYCSFFKVGAGIFNELKQSLHTAGLVSAIVEYKHFETGDHNSPGIMKIQCSIEEKERVQNLIATTELYKELFNLIVAEAATS